MSLAPASSRGAFLKARLAVNGIQCAARSLGTLTADGRGLLASMAGLFEFCGETVGRQFSSFTGRSKRRETDYFRRDRAFLRINRDDFAAFQRFANPRREPRTPRLPNLRCQATEIRFADKPLQVRSGSGRSRTT